MKFYYKYSDKIYTGIPYIVEDTSVLFKESIEIKEDFSFREIDFSILLGGNWRFSLDACSKTGKCIVFICFLDTSKYKAEKLIIPQNRKGELFFVPDDIMERGSGTHYFPFENTCYYDETADVICYGNPYIHGETIEFATNTYAVLRAEQLVAIYIKISNIKEYLVSEGNVLRRKIR